MFKKLGLHRGSQDNADGQEVDEEHDDELENPGRQYRATSEPTQNLLSSIPSHLRLNSSRRSPSVADSTFPGEEGQLTPGSSTTSSDPLGLSLVQSASAPEGDLIFVHGLGGSSRKTWSWNRDVDQFWPPWLLTEPGLSRLRIWTFGYNANFRTSDTGLIIIDFAKDLLLRMLTFSTGIDEGNKAVGNYPIVFVAHSMGGLVVKKAYILGKTNDRYQDMISRVAGFVFLSTPHKGSTYARTLNNILSANPLNSSQKAYLSELEINSTSLQDINEQFKNICGNLSLVSFYETLKTSLAPGVKRLIVEKESGILGYPREHTTALNADHHTICKFKSPEDSNYVHVRNVIKMVLSDIIPHNLSMRRSSSVTILKPLEIILGICEAPEEDLDTIRRQAMPGSCQWIFERESFLKWAEVSEGTPRMFLLTGLPATGKSTLASVVIDHLQTKYSADSCQYHFFFSGHQIKRTVAYLLRSIAFQVARANPDFREKLLAFHEETGITCTELKAQVIWDKVFEGILFQSDSKQALFWVVDALDEADSSDTLVNLFAKFQSRLSIKIFLVGRPSKELSALTSFGPRLIAWETMSTSDTLDDIRTYVRTAVRQVLPYDERMQDDIIDQILRKASGSFLWVELALDTLKDNWHMQKDIQRTLNDVPPRMESLYSTMLTRVANQPLRLRSLATRILTWAVCSNRPLRIHELQEALKPEFDGFTSLDKTVVEICGHFIRISNSKISLIHETARQYLLDEDAELAISINRHQGHEHIATTCIQYLSNSNLRRTLMKVSETAHTGQKSNTDRLAFLSGTHPFLAYATANWAYHVGNATYNSDNLLNTLSLFLQKNSLVWINAVALSSNLRILTQAALYLKAYAKGCERRASRDPPAGLKIKDVKFLQLWATDFIHLVGRFGANLVQRPSAIYHQIPPFCPRGSMLGKFYGSASSAVISLAGISSAKWDDCLARVLVGQDQAISKVLSTEKYFITLVASTGLLVIWYAETCEEARRMSHQEYVSMMVLNKANTLLATAGAKTTQVWDLSSGKRLWTLPKTSHSRIMAIAFRNCDSELLVGRDDCSIACRDLSTSEQKWEISVAEENDEDHSCPRLMNFSPDAQNVALAYRGKPVLVWDISSQGTQQPRRCIREEDRRKKPGDVWNAPEVVSWAPEGGSLLILYQDTVVVDWHILDDLQFQHNHLGAREMTISQDGNLLLTSDNRGSVSVWTFPKFHLVYKLTYEEFVRDLAFSPDGERIYDVRGPVCLVWEPDALVRSEHFDRDDQTSIFESSLVSEPVISQDDNTRSQITALTCDEKGYYYCCGKDDGSVSIHDMLEGKRIRKVYNHSASVSVIALTWSLTEKFMVSADDSGRIIAKRLESRAPGKWGVFALFETRIEDAVQQLLFSPDERLLLISTSTGDHVWDLRTKSKLCDRRWGARSGRRWINHPTERKLLVWIDPDEVRILEWSSLQTPSEKDSKLPPSVKGDKASSKGPSGDEHRPTLCSLNMSGQKQGVRWISQTPNERYLMYDMQPESGYGFGQLHLELLPIDNPESWIERQPIRKRISGLSDSAKHLIGSFQNHVVFLDHQHCLCTWEVDDALDSVKTHFPLPKDWLNPATLRLATLNQHGTLLCPRNGEVAIVRYKV